MHPANDTKPLTYVLAKDETVQIAAEMTDDLHRVCWGRLWMSTQPHAAPLIHVADAKAWALSQRETFQISTADRLAALRAPRLAKAA